MPELVCYIGDKGPHIRYAVTHVLRRMLGWDAVVIDREAELPAGDVPTLIYADQPIGQGSHIRPAAEGTKNDADVFSFAWELLSLKEDHDAGSPRDEHGRVLETALLAMRNGWSDRPVLDERVLAFAASAKQSLPSLPPVRRNYRSVATLDVDNGFMYLGREPWRSLGSACKDLLRGDVKKITERYRVLRGCEPDPYDVYELFRALSHSSADRTIVNFLVAPRGPHDHAVGTSHALMRQRMKQVADHSEVGIHPSYRSTEEPELILREKQRLEEVIGRPVSLSRQHFLRKHLPSTYLQLIDAGISEDHSLGSANHIGFRAGTCTPFPYFDLIKQRETELMLWPFAVMDSALAYKLALSPDKAIARTRNLVDAVKAVQGTFISVWHERFLSDHGPEKGWRRVAEEIIRYAKA